MFLIIKEFVQPKKSLNRESLIWKEQRRGWERERGGCAGQQAVIFKVRIGLGGIEGSYRETNKHRDRADNKNPKQSRVAQLVSYKFYQSHFNLWHGMFVWVNYCHSVGVIRFSQFQSHLMKHIPNLFLCKCASQINIMMVSKYDKLFQLNIVGQRLML